MAYSTSSYPYDTVVIITDTIGSQSWQGSGVLISPDEVLTASHVVYIQGVGTANNIVVTPGYNHGSSPYGSADGTYFHYFPIDDANRFITNEQSQYDYAVIHLSTPFPSAGYMGIESNFAGGSVNITGYPSSAGGAQVDSTQIVTLDPNYTLLDGTALGEGSSGGPVWIETAGGASVVGLVSSESDTNSTGYNNLITTAEFNQIEAWVQQDDAASTPTPTPIPTPTPTPTPGLAIQDTTTGQPVSAVAQPYTGPVSGLTSEYITATTDSLNISVSTPNWFIHTSSGDDAIAVTSGTNVLDGSTGSNFLSGGSGTDTFFVDDRAATASIWSTINNFHASDAVTLWGVTQSDFTLSWLNGAGAAGYTGLTLDATEVGKPQVLLTLAGFNQTDLTNGRLSVSFGTSSGSAYMFIHENS
jgi:V8-like Glu-specific endopeptidase